MTSALDRALIADARVKAAWNAWARSGAEVHRRHWVAVRAAVRLELLAERYTAADERPSWLLRAVV